MNSKCILKACTAAAIVCGSVYAKEAEKPVVQEEKEMSLSDFVSAEVSVALDSKFVSYGLIDNKDPIVTPAASLTFFDTAYLGVSAIFDTSTYGKKAGYGNRGGRYIELDPEAGISYSFSPEDFSWLPTTIDVGFGYVYEYHPRSMGHGSGEPGDNTQFLSLEFGLPDILLEPVFVYERDIDRDDGSYLNLEIGHTFALIEAKEEDADPTLDFRLSAAQGFGNSQRVKGYLSKDNGDPLDHAGLMDTCFKGELTWRPFEMLAVSGYIAYYDFLFDQHIKDAADDYEATGSDDSSNFVCGLAVTASF